MRAAPAVSRAICIKKSAHEHTGSAETLRPSLRNGFTAYFVLSPVNGSFATVARKNYFSRTWRQHRGARTTRLRRPPKPRSSVEAFRVHRIPPHVRDDREPPLSSGETGEVKSVICPTAKAKYFRAEVWTGFGVICPSGGFVESAQQFCLSRRLVRRKFLAPDADGCAGSSPSG